MQHISAITHFHSKIKQDTESGCWLWQGGKKPNGYGVFCVPGKRETPFYAHRWSYEYHKGPIAEGLVIDHLCRIRHCVNPDHLEAVTTSVNVRRGNKGNMTHCPKGHPYDENNTYIQPSNGTRSCRQCRGEFQRKRYIHKIRPLKTHCPKGHPYTEDNIYRYDNTRQCKICQCTNSLANKLKREQGISQPRLKRTHCSKGHPYSEENTYIDPTGRRFCCICRREYGRSKYMLKPSRSKKYYSTKEWEDLKAYYSHTCLCCGRNDVKLTADHVIPLAKGGASTIDNIQPLCQQCNNNKRANSTDYRPKIIRDVL